MKYNNVDQIRKETMYRTPCSEPDRKYLFETVIGKPGRKFKVLREAACASCLVRIECMTDAINVILDSSNNGSAYAVEYMAGKTHDQQVEIAKTFRQLGIQHVTVDHIDGFPAAAIRSASPELL